MRLTLMRHALAATHGPWSDADRPLTPEGEEQARQSAQGLSRLELDIEGIRCSPAVRCRDTASIVAQELGLGNADVEVWEDLSLGASMVRLVDGLQESMQDSVLWVGHQPVLEHLTSVLLLGEGTLPFQLLPAACIGLHCVFRDDFPQATLLWAMRSHELAMLRAPGA